MIVAVRKDHKLSQYKVFIMYKKALLNRLQKVKIYLYSFYIA